jgi:hypothetical protein
VLRLLHDALGSDYDTHNAALRDVAHGISRLRDADALRETFDALHARYAHVIAPEVARRIDAELDAEARRRAESSLRLRRAATHTLASGRDEVIEAVTRAAGRHAVRDGLERSYRRARMAVPVNGVDAGPAELHLWRRRVKDVWYQVRLFDHIASDARALARTLKKLEKTLGDDHNLTCLRDAIAAGPERYGDAADVAVVLGCIAERQRALRERAFRIGPPMFVRRPKRMRKRAHRWLR